MNTAVLRAPPGLLRGAAFDTTFIAGIALVALASGVAVTLDPDLYLPILTLDLWLLGYHHVVATYTRLAFDTESLREHRKLVFYLPWAVAAGVLALTLTFGIWVLFSIYLYWQWFHYARQSEGVSKAYAARSVAAGRDVGNALVARVAFWSVPVAGILNVSARDPGAFLSLPLLTIPTPWWLANAALVFAAVAVATWLTYQVIAWRRGAFAAPYVAYVCSHFVMFGVGYIGLNNLDHGWLTVNIWHNAQYILFVWLFNNRRFNGSLDPKRLFLSTISQSSRFPLYIAVCLTLSTVTYLMIDWLGVGAVENALGISAAVAAVVIYQTVNFHHYVVDALIWKLRKPAVGAKLGVA